MTDRVERIEEIESKQTNINIRCPQWMSAAVSSQTVSLSVCCCVAYSCISVPHASKHAASSHVVRNEKRPKTPKMQFLLKCQILEASVATPFSMRAKFYMRAKVYYKYYAVLYIHC